MTRGSLKHLTSDEIAEASIMEALNGKRLPEFAAKVRERAGPPKKDDEQPEVAIEKEGKRWLVKDGDRWLRVLLSDRQIDIYEGEPRDYFSTVLPTLSTAASAVPPHQGTPLSVPAQPVLLALYAEAGSHWRTLTDVRFKLLGLVPAVSVVAWVQLATAEMLGSSFGAVAAILVALAGLRLTRALEVYDRRNDTLYNDAISRGRKIEEELGVDTGIFLGRRRAVDKSNSHGAAVRTIYDTVKWGWIGVALWFALRAVSSVLSGSGALAM